MTAAISAFAIAFLVLGVWILLSLPLALVIARFLDLGDDDD